MVAMVACRNGRNLQRRNNVERMMKNRISPAWLAVAMIWSSIATANDVERAISS